jgi:hypothetical protein
MFLTGQAETLCPAANSENSVFPGFESRQEEPLPPVVLRLERPAA